MFVQDTICPDYIQALANVQHLSAATVSGGVIGQTLPPLIGLRGMSMAGPTLVCPSAANRAHPADGGSHRTICCVIMWLSVAVIDCRGGSSAKHQAAYPAARRLMLSLVVM